MREAGVVSRKGHARTARGDEPRPSAERLRQLIHVDHHTLEEVSAMFGVTRPTLANWLKKDDIPIPKPWEWAYRNRIREMPSAEELRFLYEDRGHTLAEIGSMVGCCWKPIANECRRVGIDVREPMYGFRGKAIPCDDGDIVRSTYERLVDNWLFSRSLHHVYEPPLPFGKYKADFLVAGRYVEIWGLNGFAAYDRRRQFKIEAYRASGITPIELNATDFRSERWQQILHASLE